MNYDAHLLCDQTKKKYDSGSSSKYFGRSYKFPRISKPSKDWSEEGDRSEVTSSPPGSMLSSISLCLDSSNFGLFCLLLHFSPTPTPLSTSVLKTYRVQNVTIVIVFLLLQCENQCHSRWRQGCSRSVSS